MQALNAFIHTKYYLLFPLVAAMLYAMGTIALKASSDRGADRGRTTFFCNFMLAVGFLLFYEWTSFPSLPQPLWPMVALAVLFVLGQIFTILALTSGDVSSVTPVFGVKAVFVGFIAAYVIGAAVDALTWVAAVCSVAGIALLQAHDRKGVARQQITAILYAFLAALTFAGFDSMTQYWSPIIGFGRLVPPAMVLGAVISLVLVPRRREHMYGVPLQALPYLVVGASLFAVQSIALISAIGYFGDAAGANVIYSSRGLWGIVFVWMIGARFGNTELDGSSPRVVLARLAGAALVTVSTILIFI
ncbi:hypothetical protein DB346_01695 [Verrucomicrobia bacterium LW23]|nr:hypothetical protein DB346_01695 [Verrucomicrobia bacterium LW23]